MTTIYSNGRFLTAAPESDIPIRRGGDSVYAQETRQLRDALVDRRGDLVQALAPLLATTYGIPKTARLGTRVDVRYRGKPTRSLGWLAWTVWHEGHGLNGGEYSEGIPSSGCVEALVSAGLFDWDALRLFPNRKWTHHPGFQALQNACVERMARLPKGHRLLLESNDTFVEGPFPPADSSATRNEDSWLVLPVLAGRADVVRHWFAQGGRMALEYNHNAVWRQAWARALEHDESSSRIDLNRPLDGNGGNAQRATVTEPGIPPAHAIVAMLEEQVIAGNVPRSGLRTSPNDPPSYLREGVLNLIGLCVENAARTHGGSASGREALLQSLERVMRRWPLDLTPRSSADHARLGSDWGDNPVPSLVAQSALMRLERQVLTDAVRAPAGTPEPAVPPRRRL